MALARATGRARAALGLAKGIGQALFNKALTCQNGICPAAAGGPLIGGNGGNGGDANGGGGGGGAGGYAQVWTMPASGLA